MKPRSPSRNKDAARQQCYPASALTAWASRVLETARVPPADAHVTAQLLVRSDLRGFGTHGLSRLKSYMERLREGDFNPHAQIQIDRRGAVWTVEADGALGQVAGQRVVEEAVTFLADQPMLWVSLRESGHLGALGMFALAAAEAGYVCLLGQRTPPLLGLPGFQRRAIGHNPFAFGAPAGEGQPPFVFDMACSVAARGHILLAAREGKAIPVNWALASDGQPTTDAAEGAAGMLLPSGDYKGMGIAMMIECLAAGLSTTAEANTKPVMRLPASGAMPRQSAFFLFLNPALIGEKAAFLAYMQHWIAYYKMAGAEQARIPGERGELSEQAALARGLSYPLAIDAELRELGSKTGIPFPGHGS